MGPQQPVEERRLFELKSIFHGEQQLPSSQHLTITVAGTRYRHQTNPQQRVYTRAADDPSVSQAVFTIMEKAPTRAFSWLKAPTSAFTLGINFLFVQPEP